MLVEFVVALEGRVNIVMLQQYAACACVLRQNQIHRLQYLDGAERHILQITNRCGYDVEHLVNLRFDDLRFCHLRFDDLSKTSVQRDEELLVGLALGVPLEMRVDVVHRLVERTESVQFIQRALHFLGIL